MELKPYSHTLRIEGRSDGRNSVRIFEEHKRTFGAFCVLNRLLQRLQLLKLPLSYDPGCGKGYSP